MSPTTIGWMQSPTSASSEIDRSDHEPTRLPENVPSGIASSRTNSEPPRMIDRVMRRSGQRVAPIGRCARLRFSISFVPAHW